MTLRKEKVEAIRKELLAKRETIAAELRQSTADFINDDATFSDAIDQAAADADKSLALQMKSRERSVLVQIDEALRRMEQGGFGECEKCGESIGDGRLKAFPFTTLCVDCKADLETESHRALSRIAI